MRHIPTTIYIDTEFFVRKGLRLNQKPFTTFINTFIKGGIRLLIPEVMERELTRHFKKKSIEISTDLRKHQRKYELYAKINSLHKKEQIEEDCFNNMIDCWKDFKDHFIVEKLPLVGDLSDVMDWYFDVKPPFSLKKNKEFPDAFIISTLEYYYKEHSCNIAVIGRDGDFQEVSAIRKYLSHFDSLDEYIEKFEPEISGKDIPLESIDFAKPITSEDLTELKSIIDRGDSPTSIEITRVLNLLKSKGTNYEYFFRQVNNSIWLNHLYKNEFFSNPPSLETNKNGQFTAPYWMPISYLIRMYDEEPETVLNIVNSIPDTNNFHVLEGIMEIVLKIDSIDSILKLSRFIIAFSENSYRGIDTAIKFLNKTFVLDSRVSDLTQILIQKFIGFNSDPNDSEKRSQFKQDTEHLDTTLKPSSRLNKFDYDKLLKKGIHPLVKREPLQISRILFDATSNMIRLKTHETESGSFSDQDYSEMWCRRLDEPSSSYININETLVHSLTYACEQVYKQEPKSIEVLDQLLRNSHWRLFKRLRQHLYAKFPNNQNLPWIREIILSHKEYGRWEHHYEFQIMIKNGCKFFSFQLLNKDERVKIFDEILDGPPRRDYQANNDDTITDEKYLGYKKHFHYKQFIPFEPILTGTYKDYFINLSEELSVDISDENYQQIGNTKSGYITQQSPVSYSEMNELDDDKLLNFINSWSDEHYDKDDFLIEVSFEGLADNFQKLFEKEIITNPERIIFWLDNKEEIKRPIYITSIIEALKEIFNAQKLINLELWVGFLNWIISKKTIRKSNHKKPSDQSSEYPEWDNSKRAVIDLISKVLKTSDTLSITIRSNISDLLSQAFEMPDYRLDQGEKVFLSQNDPFSEAINNTRSQVLEAWVLFGFWVRKFDSKDKVFEFTQVLDKRLSDTKAIPLTSPEYAMIGVQFNNLYSFNEEWAIQNKGLLFPQKNKINWQAAFTSYIRYSRPYKVIFEVLKGDFEFAIINFNLLENINGFGSDVIRQFGNHIFTYFLWNEFELIDHSLIFKYYSVTDKDMDSWINLFSHVGYILKDNVELKENLIERIKQFFNWRLNENCSKELSYFYDWLGASCIESSWLLESYSKILDILEKNDENLLYAIEPLYKNLNDSEELVVECFRKLTGLLEKDNYVYIPVDKAKEILKVGLNHTDKEVKQNAEEAKENLLKVGRFEFMEI